MSAFFRVIPLLPHNNGTLIFSKRATPWTPRSAYECLIKTFQLTGLQPKNFNTDQGCQFSSKEWLEPLEQNGIQISMDGKRCWCDNVFIERLWRSIKHEKLRLWSYSTLQDLEALVEDWMDFYNLCRWHQELSNRTPWSLYQEAQLETAKTKLTPLTI